MVIYGVALLAACLLIGKALGELIGMAIGVHSDVGGRRHCDADAGFPGP